MSALDKFREQLYEKDEDEIDMDDVASAVSKVADSICDPYSAAKFLIIAIFVEISSVVAIVFASRTIGDWIYNEYAFIVFLLLPFIAGAAIAYSGFQLFQFIFRPDSGHPSVSSGMMSGYAAYDARQRNWILWFVTALGGVVNSMALFFLYSVS